MVILYISYSLLEFRALDFLNEALFELKAIRPEINLGCPLACMVDYKGIRALAISIPPVSRKNLRMGLNDNGTYVWDLNLMDSLKGVANLMNIKVKLNSI